MTDWDAFFGALGSFLFGAFLFDAIFFDSAFAEAIVKHIRGKDD